MLTATILATTGLLVANQVYSLQLENWICFLPLTAGIILYLFNLFAVKRMANKMMSKKNWRF